METSLNDLRHAARHLRKSPGFTLTAVLTLTMAMGANVVVFGVLNSLVLHPMPLRDSRRVYSIQAKVKGGIAVSYPNYIDVRDRVSTFSGVSVFRIARIGLDAGNSVQPVWGYEAGGNYFDVLGVQPVVGRLFHASDEHGVNGSPYAVLSYLCWQARFGGDSAIAGKTVLLNKRPYTILGVAHKGFYGTERFIWPELWVPIQNEPEIEGYNWIDARDTSNGWVIGRLRPDVTEGQANAELDSVASQLARQYPDVNKYFSLHLAKPGFLGDELGGPVRAFLFGVMLMAGIVLFAACANLGGLYAAKTLDRAREFGIRLALGSSRWRLVRQMCIECCLVAILGGGTAALISSVLLGMLSNYRLPLDFPVQLLVAPDGTTYFLTCLLVLLTGLLFSCIPAIRIFRTNPNQAIKSAIGPDSARGRFASRDILLAVQVALCCMLVTVSLVAFRGLARAMHAPLGVRPQGVTLAVFDAHLANYKDSEVPVLQRQILERVSSLPGVTVAAFSNSTPLSVDQSSTGIFPAGTPAFTDENLSFFATYYQTSPEYFKAAGTRLLSGRDFSWHDDSHSPSVAIVNQTFARRLFQSEEIVGRSFSANGRQMEVIGLAEDGKYTSLTEDPTPALFLPILQQPNTSTVLVVRSLLPPSAIAGTIMRAIHSVDRGLPVFSAGSWRDSLEGLALFPARAATVALGILASLALMLAVTGVAALAGYSVSKRLRELAIRKALGARNPQILACGLGRPLLLLGLGSVVGMVLAMAAGRVLASIVYQASPADPWVIVAAPMVMLIAGILSTALPGHKALTVNPATLLREA
jgi:predicted permease